MALTDLVAIFLLGALVLYLIMGIADFGGGILSGLAFGPRAEAQRRVIDKAIAPIWEANHVWLILALVVLFTAFPSAYRTLAEGLNLPLELMLIGIVLRGSAFVFRQYGPTENRGLWRRVFSAASFTTPFFLGMIMGAITSGSLRPSSGTNYLGWWAPFPALVGGLTTCAGAFLASVYLTNETKDEALTRDFTRRAYLTAGLLVVLAVLSALFLPEAASHFRDRLGAFWWIPAAASFALAGSLLCLKRKAPKVARVLAAAAVASLVLGWATAQYPYLIAPELTLTLAAAPPETLRPLLVALVAGSVLVLPSLVWLMVTFKKQRN